MSIVGGNFGGSRKNKNGGWYQPGDPYPHTKKVEIVEIYFTCWTDQYPRKPKYKEIAEKAKVGEHFVQKVMKEFEDTGTLKDPKKRAKKKQKITVANSILDPVEETFLLAMRAEDPSRPTASYVEGLKKQFGKIVSKSYLNKWWLTRFDFPAAFRKSSMIPMDKFTATNWFRYYEYRMIVTKINNNLRFNFIDEKHITNHNGIDLKVRRNPLTGKIDGIPVSGNFREACSLVACISVNPRKQQHTYYTMTKETVDASYFMEFIMSMVRDGFLLPKEVLVLDNAAVHCGAEAQQLEDLLWNTKIDGVQLQVLVLFLPTRAPELNPIELIFHILAKRLKSYHYRNTVGINHGVVDRVHAIMHELDHPLLKRCYEHCGYTLTAV